MYSALIVALTAINLQPYLKRDSCLHTHQRLLTYLVSFATYLLFIFTLTLVRRQESTDVTSKAEQNSTNAFFSN